MALSSSSLLSATPVGVALASMPEVVPRTRELFGPAYQNQAFTQVKLSAEDFGITDGLARPIRLTCVRKTVYPQVRETIGEVFPFCVVLDNWQMPFLNLKPASQESMEVLLSENYTIFAFTTVPKFRLFGIDMPLTRSSVSNGVQAWELIEVFICGVPRPEFVKHKALHAWLRNVACGGKFRDACGQARQMIADVVEKASQPHADTQPVEAAL